MHSHSHGCDHYNIGYCSHCDVPYCRNCGREWGVRRSHHQWLWPYNTYGVTSGLTNTMYGAQMSSSGSVTGATLSNLVPLSDSTGHTHE